jgi:hypothetical protein
MMNLSRGVPQRREKCFGNGVKNLSGSADVPKLLSLINAEKKMPFRQRADFQIQGKSNTIRLR